MKDAFGGAFVLKVMMIFFVVFICFMTVAINYAKTFRVKDNVIAILERNNNSNRGELTSKIENYLRDVSYSYATNQKVINNCASKLHGGFHTDGSSGILNGNISGVCIVPIGNKDSYHYRVYSYFVVDFPLFHLGIVIPVSGESRTIDKIFT